MNTDERGWPVRPKRGMHAALGRRQRWLHESGRMMIERFLGGSKRFIAAVITEGRTSDGRWKLEGDLLGDYPSLVRAQRAAERRLKGLLAAEQAGPHAKAPRRKEKAK